MSKLSQVKAIKLQTWYPVTFVRRNTIIVLKHTTERAKYSKKSDFGFDIAEKTKAAYTV